MWGLNSGKQVWWKNLYPLSHTANHLLVPKQRRPIISCLVGDQREVEEQKSPSYRTQVWDVTQAVKRVPWKHAVWVNPADFSRSRVSESAFLKTVGSDRGGHQHWPPASRCACTHNAWKRTHRALVLPFDNYGWYPVAQNINFAILTGLVLFLRSFILNVTMFCNIVSNQSVPQPHWLQTRLTDSKQTTLTPSKTHWGQPSLEHI